MSDDISITLTFGERDLLLKDTTAVDERFLAKMRLARVVDNKIRFSIAPEDLDQMLDEIAFEANHARSARKETEFNSLYHRLSAILEDHTGYSDSPDESADELIDELIEPQMLQGAVGLVKQFREQFQGSPRWPLPLYFEESHKDLGGLTAVQARELCCNGWWGPEASIELNLDIGLGDLAGSRLLRNARLLLNALHETGGAALTVKGNLSRQFVGQMLERLDIEQEYKAELLLYFKVINEMDLWPLHTLRLVCLLAKLVRKYKKRLVATNLGLEMADDEMAGNLYALLFNSLFTEFNLGYGGRLSDENAYVVQEFVPYSLFRLSLLETDKEYAISDLPTVLLPPSLVDELNSASRLLDAEFYMCDILLDRLEDFGLVSMRRSQEPGDSIEKDNWVHKTPLFDRFIKMRFAAQ